MKSAPAVRASAAAFTSMSATMTRAPCSAARRAAASPIPEPPPTTRMLASCTSDEERDVAQRHVAVDQPHDLATDPEALAIGHELVLDLAGEEILGVASHLGHDL